MTVQVKNLKAGYGSKTVLDGISLSVKEGSISALLGCNGSGKTTFLRCINDILRPMQGEVVVKGKNVSRLSRTKIARLVSMVPQGSMSPFAYSCLDVVLMGEASRLSFWSSPGPDARRRALRVCEQVGISHLVDNPCNQLSGGEQQLVLLARALFQDAPVMLLDEPNAHLDFRNQHRIMELIRQTAQAQNVTVLITLHDPNLTLTYCDDAIMLKDGKVIAHGPVSKVMTDANLAEIYGHNIKTDLTTSGIPVVIPRNGRSKSVEASYSAQSR